MRLPTPPQSGNGFRTDSRRIALEETARALQKELLARAAKDGRVEVEAWRRRKDGSLFWASVTLTALHDSHGQLRGFGKITRDLTHQREAQLALKQKEDELFQSRKLPERAAHKIMLGQSRR